MAKVELVGLLPAAGLAKRLLPYRSPKELFPLLLPGAADGSTAIPAPICHFALQAMKSAAVDRCVVMISEEKCEIVRVLTDGAGIGVSLGYLVQTEALGLTHVVKCARPWLGDADVVFALPDTVVFPGDALKTLHERRKAIGADLMLGVFPTDEPERLAPVEIAEDGRVLSIRDKPVSSTIRNTWGVLAWSSRFTDFCSEWHDRPRDGKEGVLSHAMEAARLAGFHVAAHWFADGVFRDVGTPAGLASTVQLLMDRGIVFRGTR